MFKVPEDFKGEFRKYLKSLRLKSAYKIPPKTRAQINLLFATLISLVLNGKEKNKII
jgi:hypothetical protein